MSDYLLSLLIFLPLAGASICWVLPKSFNNSLRYLSAGISLTQLLISIYILISFDKTIEGVTTLEGFQFVERTQWIRLSLGEWGTLSAEYLVGVDGINVLMVLLSAIVLFIGNLSSWRFTGNAKGYYSLYLLLNMGIIGCFLALDFLLFYLFFEFMLLPMYFLIGLWGGARREYASIKFFLYTLAGSLLILIVMIGLALSSDINGMMSFNLVALTGAEAYREGAFLSWGSAPEFWGMPIRSFFMLLLLVGFAIKIPVVPLHTWLPDAHVEAPTSISIILAGLLLKTGAYGMIRTGFFIFPDVAPQFSSYLAAFGAISIVYAGLNALAQKDLKKMIAYSSISHMGFVLIGLASFTVEGFTGAIYQMFSHGILSPLLFILAGILYDRTKNRAIYDYSGLSQQMPAYALFTALAFFAALGLPGFSGFIAEVMVLLGAFKSVGNFIPLWTALLAVSGLLISAAYFLWTFQRMFLGLLYSKKNLLVELSDMTFREKGMTLLLLLISIAIGIFPSLILEYINTDVLTALQHLIRDK